MSTGQAAAGKEVSSPTDASNPAEQGSLFSQLLDPIPESSTKIATTEQDGIAILNKGPADSPLKIQTTSAGTDKATWHNQSWSDSDAVACKQDVASRIEGRLGHVSLSDLVTAAGPDYDFFAKQYGANNDGQRRTAAVAAMVTLWAHTSNDGFPRALAMQDAARDEFGLQGTMEWEKARQGLKTFGGPGNVTIDAPLETKTKDEILTESETTMREFLRAQYDETQEMFKEQGIKAVTLYRGQNEEPSYDKQLPNKDDYTSSFQGLHMRPISSWTSNPNTTDTFGNYSLAATVPVNQILSTPRTGFGCLNEQEFVVLGNLAEATESFDPESFNPEWEHVQGYQNYLTKPPSTEIKDRFVKSYGTLDPAPTVGLDIKYYSSMRQIIEQGPKDSPVDLSTEGKGGDLWDSYTEETAVECKKDVAHRVAARMPKSITTDSIIEAALDGSTALNGDKSRWDWKERETGVATLIAQWANSSNDNKPMSLAIQLAAKDEFGLDNTRGWAHGVLNPKAHWGGDVAKNVAAIAEKKAEDLYAKHGTVLRAFLRAQYEDTQAMLKEQGVKSVSVYRGHTSPPPAQVKADKALKDLGHNVPYDHASPQLTAMVGDIDPTIEPDLQMRPLSSWSSSLQSAQQFGDYMYRAQVPANQVLSTARTGLGCLNEHEWVLIGNLKDVRNVAT
jgi:hypothetical protein